jgi:hypothetical protein
MSSGADKNGDKLPRRRRGCGCSDSKCSDVNSPVGTTDEYGFDPEEQRRLFTDMRAAGFNVSRPVEFVSQSDPGTYPWHENMLRSNGLLNRQSSD